ncbi:MAG: PAS domain S-box protein [Prolixibacteraceae bacterium]|nr:PAS domain S-box protein [Prolixibacteraceae bacterium]
MRILILEDNKSDADLSQRAIKRAFDECTVDIAPMLADAKILLEKDKNYDVALLDMNLPDGSGLEILSEIRQAGLPTAVIMFTSAGNEELAVAALQAGADDYIAKKNNYTEKLPNVIRFALEGFQKKKQIQEEKINVLYIEHNKLDIDLTRRHFKKYAPNIHFETVPMAEKALGKLEKEQGPACNGKYQVLLMDYRLPGMCALDFVKTVKQEINAEIPIIIVTGQGDEEIAVQSLKLGVSDYLTKSDNYLFRLPSLITSAYQKCLLKHKQAELAESEAKYRLLAEYSTDVIFILDKEMNYRYVSPAVKTLRGYEPEEAVEFNLSQVLTPESYKIAIEEFQNVFKPGFLEHENGQVPKTIELEMFRKDRSTVWTEVKATLLKDEAGNTTGVIGITRDISERKKADEELRKLSRALEQSHDSVIITNTKGEIEYCNAAVAKISGYSREELIGQNPRIFKSGNKTKAEYKALWNTIMAGKVWEGEFRNKKKNGALYWEATTISPITDTFGKITHYLAIRKDITEQKLMTRQLIEAKERAEESDRLKTAFLANMSHEIRTPMNSIMGFASLLSDEDSLEIISNYAKIIVDNSEQLVTIIDGIVLYSKLQTEMFSYRPSRFSAGQMLSDIQKSFNVPEFQKKGVALQYDCDIEKDTILETDQAKLKQIITNLVLNAIKYTHVGIVTIGCSKAKNDYRFYVKDTGIGITEKDLPHIFERFYRGSNFDESTTRGTGLGLSIAKELAEKLGGSLTLETEPEKGSTFYLTIPRKKQVNEKK